MSDKRTEDSDEEPGDNSRAHDEDQVDNEHVSPIIEESLEEIEEDTVDVERELAAGELFDTQHGEGHTYNPQQAEEQGLTYTPPTDPPVIPSEDDLQGAEFAAGFAPSMEESDAEVEGVPPRVEDNDLDLLDRINLELRENSETADLTEVKVLVHNGVVSLLGTVLSEGDTALVYEVVGDIEGVVEVRNYLQVSD
jgi:hypothetical protein